MPKPSKLQHLKQRPTVYFPISFMHISIKPFFTLICFQFTPHVTPTIYLCRCSPKTLPCPYKYLEINWVEALSKNTIPQLRMWSAEETLSRDEIRLLCFLASTTFIHYSESEFLMSSLENLRDTRQDVRGCVAKRRTAFIRDLWRVFV